MPTTTRQARFNPATGHMELGEGAARYGTSGELLGDLPGGGTFSRSQGYDPRYYEQYQMDTGDGGTQTAWRLRQDVQERLGDRMQVNQPGVVGRNPDGSIMEGQGFNEVLDPSLVTWDDEFGWVMPRSNLSGSDPDDKARWDRIRAAAIAATLGGAAYVGGAFGGLGAGAETGVNAGLDAFEAGSFLSGGAPEATALANSAGVAGATTPSTFDRFLESYISDSGSTATMPFGSEEIVNLGIDTEAAGIARELGVYGNAFDASPSIWDTLSNFGSGLVDKLPSIANAARLFGDPGTPTQARASGGGGGGGGFAGGSGGGFGRGDGSAFDPMKLKQVLTLAEYLGGRR